MTRRQQVFAPTSITSNNARHPEPMAKIESSHTNDTRMKNAPEMNSERDELHSNDTLLQSALTSKMLVYNRVHKAGSSTFTAYIKKLSKPNGFHVTRSKTHYQRRLGVEAQVRHSDYHIPVSLTVCV